MRNLSDKRCREIKTHNVCPAHFCENPTLCEIFGKKCGRDWQITDDSITRRMRFACWIIQATDTHPEYVILLLFHNSNGYWNAPLYYVVRNLCVFLTLINTLPAGPSGRVV